MTIKHVYAFETWGAVEKEQQQYIQNVLAPKLTTYQNILTDKFQLIDVPKAVIWTTGELATTVFSTNPVAAYTCQDCIYMCADKSYWLEIFATQLEGLSLPTVTKYYETHIESQLIELLCHELTHHLSLFPSDFEEYEDIWFEEGMCFYLPRAYMLSKEELDEITMVEEQMYQSLKGKWGNHSLTAFGQSSYEESLSSMMFDYWRSYLSVKKLVERYNGDAFHVLQLYNQWYVQKDRESFESFFQIKSIDDLIDM